jgi:integral membrane sensor domain MASE1
MCSSSGAGRLGFMARLSPSGDLRPGRRVLRAALIGAALGAATCLVAAVLPLFFLGIALDRDGASWADTVTGIVTAAMVIVPIVLFLAAVPLLRKARIRPAWAVALISPLATVALAAAAIALSGLDPYAALLGAPLFATGGYALGALLTTRRS